MILSFLRRVTLLMKEQLMVPVLVILPMDGLIHSRGIQVITLMELEEMKGE